jgi:hypothetical protein
MYVHSWHAQARIDPTDWSLHTVVTTALERPIDVKFDPSGSAAYILDFGHFEMLENSGLDAEARSGKVWRVPVRDIM